MSIQSMTGFSRDDGQSADFNWVWELRSVNGKNLDIRLRLPSGFEDLEAQLRKVVSTSVSRGNIQISLQISENTASMLPRINEAVATELWRVAGDLSKKIGGDLPKLSDIMLMKGVVEFDTPDLTGEERASRNSLLLKSFGKAVEKLANMRSVEGEAIRKYVLDQLERIEELRVAIESSEARSEKAIRKRLGDQIDRLLESTDKLDPQRLHQEAAILAAKADLQEEIDRLEVHISSALELLNSGGPVGRRLDFLAQEFNRECNTICSKSNAAEVTTLGLDMKIVIDQFREQIQNLE